MPNLIVGSPGRVPSRQSYVGRQSAAVTQRRALVHMAEQLVVLPVTSNGHPPDASTSFKQQMVSVPELHCAGETHPNWMPLLHVGAATHRDPELVTQHVGAGDKAQFFPKQSVVGTPPS
jgi:hypothetical protein